MRLRTRKVVLDSALQEEHFRGLHKESSTSRNHKYVRPRRVRKIKILIEQPCHVMEAVNWKKALSLFSPS